LDESGSDKLQEYLSNDSRWGEWTCAGFWGEWYLESYPDVTSLGISPLEHYVIHGEDEGRLPNPFFDPRWYRARYRDLDACRQGGLLQHYIGSGWREGRSAGPQIDPTWILSRSGYSVGEADPVEIALSALSTNYEQYGPGEELISVVKLNSQEIKSGTNPIKEFAIGLEVGNGGSVFDSAVSGHPRQISVRHSDSHDSVNECEFNIQLLDDQIEIQLKGSWYLDLDWIRCSLVGKLNLDIFDAKTAIEAMLNSLTCRTSTVQKWASTIQNQSPTLSLAQSDSLQLGAAGTGLRSKTVLEYAPMSKFIPHGVPRRLRLLLVSHEQSLTGAPIFLEQLGIKLGTNEFEVMVTSLRSDLKSPCFERFGIRHIHLGDLTGGRRTLHDDWLLTDEGLAGLRILLDIYSPDVIVLGTVNASSVAEEITRRRIPYLMLVHERTGPSRWSRLSTSRFDKAVRLAMRSADSVIFGSEDTMEIWSEWVEEPVAKCVPTWRSIEAIPQEDESTSVPLRKLLGIPEEHKVFMSVATFEPRKRLGDIQHAFEAISSPNAHLIFIGDYEGEGSVELKEFRKRLNTHERIHCLPPRMATLLLYREADFLVMASERETFPLSVQEAVLAGVPVISSMFPGWEQLFPENYKLLYPVGDLLKLTELMERLEVAPHHGKAQCEILRKAVLAGEARSTAEIISEIEQTSLNTLIRFIPREWL